MPVATLEELMEAGVHFGHQTKRWNPKMKPFIWGDRNNIHILDLTKTVRMLDQAYEFMKQSAAQGKKIVFVGTKKQAAEIIEQEAQRAGCHFITKRWFGGMLTNYDTIRTRINRLRELEEMRDSGHIERFMKKEQAVLTRELSKLSRSLGGVKDMRGLPDIIYVVDQKREMIAVQEANKMGIPVVGLADTNCDPNVMDYPIPGNDDAIKAIRLITSLMADAILEGRQLREKNQQFKGKADAASLTPEAFAASAAEQAPAPEAAVVGATEE
jgi:small subunit ribosomal protein S2